MTHRVILTGKESRERAKLLIDRAPVGWLVEFREKKRTDEQNHRLHAMLRDIRKQVEGADQWTLEDWKLRFMNALRNETRFLPELDGNGMFPVGQKTSTLSVAQFSALIELVFEWGARNGVRWTEERNAA